ncbi:MAG: hypothetical protein HS122_08800 [Opitutaceae bacterium]|nr:hypothetical protein [Opitutaceae bacterium]
MIDSPLPLAVLKAEVGKLEDDLRARCEADAVDGAPLQAQYEASWVRSLMLSATRVIAVVAHA